MDNRKFPRLSTALIGSAILAFLLALAVICLPIRSQVAAFERNVQSEGVLRAGRALQLAVSRTVEREWRSLEAVAGRVNVADSSDMRNFAEAVPQASAAVAWVGIASPGGRVLASTGRVREGEDMSGFRWFREGLAGGSVGSVFRPTGQEGRSGSESGLINISAPVLDDFGNARGVVVYSLRIDWLTDYMVRAARELGLDIAVRSESGETILELAEQVEGPIAPEIAALSDIGHDLTRVKPGAGGYVVGVFPNMLTGDMPHFGWDLIVRVPAVQGQASLAAFMKRASWTIAGLFLALAAATVFYAIHFLRPIEELSRAAGAIAEGDTAYPPDNRSSRESAALSAALARIQSRILDGPLKPAE